MDHDEGGFTLIELMVVVFIIGILVAIASASFIGFERTAEKSGAADQLRSAALTARALRVDAGEYTDLLTELPVRDPGVTLDPTGENGIAVLVSGAGDACLVTVTQSHEIFGVWLSATELPAPQMWAQLGAVPATCPDYAGALVLGFTTTPF